MIPLGSMVSMAAPNTAETNEDGLKEALAAVEEMIAEFGVRALMAACLRSSAGEEFNRLGGNATLRISQVILREIAFSKDPQLEAEIMALGAGIILNEGESMRALAKKHGISPAAISKRVVTFCDENNLPPSLFMRTAKDRKTYALTNRPRT